MGPNGEVASPPLSICMASKTIPHVLYCIAKVTLIVCKGPSAVF